MSSAIAVARRIVIVLGVMLSLAVGAASAQAAFGIAGFDGETLDAAGAGYTQAGGHPFTASTSIQFNRTTDAEGKAIPDESVRQIEVELPPGLVGNPRATPTRCTEAQLTGGAALSIGTCPISSQVGITDIEVPEDFFSVTTVPVYNMVPAGGEPAQLGIRYLTTDIHIRTSVRSDGDYGVTATLDNVSNAIPMLGTTLNLWGVPADPRHDTERGECLISEAEDACSTDAPPVAFWTLPTACTPADVGLDTRLHAESWLGSIDDAAFLTHLPPGPPAPGPQQGPTGCDRVPFNPTFSVNATTSAADSPTGLEVELEIPQAGLSNPSGLASSSLRDATVTLPAGMSVNPASAGALATCTPAQIGLLGGGAPGAGRTRFSREPATCPDASKLGTVSVDTPVLDEPLEGSVYLAQQGSNPFGSLLAVYIVVAGDGVVVKLPGRISPDPESGRVTATFADNPQLPFERLRVRFFAGVRAALTTPERCGSYPVTARFVPWSGGPAVERSSQIAIGSGPGGGACPAGGFDPDFAAGTADPTAGRFSPFLLAVTRDDGSQRLGSLQVTLPEGLLGKLAGIPYCPEAALAAVPAAVGTGSAQLASPSCPAASQVGSVSAGAGSGPSPFYVRTGRAYLAGPYRGAPLSLVVIVPALAGPFDLGNVVVRTALRVDPKTTQITADSDPLPTILQGIPLDLRDLRLDVDRRDFTLNPTSCEPMQVTSTIVGLGGAVARPADRFQVTSCERLGFKPKLSLRLRGGTRRGQYPKLVAKLKAARGDANIGRVSVALPHAEFLAQEHIKTICTRPQFAADQCPEGSVYGFAETRTPLLDHPLKGRVYLRANGGERELPDLVVALRGQIDVDLVGYIDSARGGIRTRFQRLPDAPVSSFTLRMKGGRKGLLVNSRSVCGGGLRATVHTTGHNGKLDDLRPRLAVASCSRGGPR